MSDLKSISPADPSERLREQMENAWERSMVGIATSSWKKR